MKQKDLRATFIDASVQSMTHYYIIALGNHILLQAIALLVVLCTKKCPQKVTSDTAASKEASLILQIAHSIKIIDFYEIELV